MQITYDQLANMAGRLAVEGRFKDDYIAGLEREVEQLRARLAELDEPGEPDPA